MSLSMKPNNSVATPSLLRQPMKVTKADFPVETVETIAKHDKENQPELINQVSNLKRKKTEVELKEDLSKFRQNKLNNTMSSLSATSTLGLDSSSSLGSSKRRALGSSSKPDLNQTISGTDAKKKLVTSVKATVTAKPSTLSRTKSASSLNKTIAISSTTEKKARPAWDVKGRLEDMEKLTAFLQSELKKNVETVHDLSTQVVDREQQITQIKETKTHLEVNVDDRRREIQQILNEKIEIQNKMAELQQQHNIQLQDLMYKYRSLETQHQTTTSSLNMSKAENESLRLSCDSQRGQISALQCEIDSLKARLNSSENLCQERKKRIEDLEIQIDKNMQTIAELEGEIREDEMLRKKLHNTIQELKGNIRVYCRIRPLLGGEVDEYGALPAMYVYPPHNDRSLEISTSCLTGVTGTKTDKKFNFSFDKVFKPTCSQQEVFEEISQLVQSALDGYNTCIFAYGQTGSGKTYTMEGPGIDSELEMAIVDPEKRGMIPRAVEQIFTTAEALKDKGWTYEMEVMYLEIYNESIRDLLISNPAKVKEEIKYEIKHDQKGVTTVTNVTTVKVRNPLQVFELLKRASKNRAVSKTNMNEHSSRSHSVFQMKLTGSNNITNDQIRGILNLIDLAGSERLDKSGTTGQHLKETQNINKSLSSLGDVIAALGNKEAHIPYRNSKLTYLLQNSLGGNSKTLMFVNISPRPTDLNETVSSLRFATKVNACEIGTAKKQAKVDLNAV